jgi:S1-C subfamily serine protease
MPVGSIDEAAGTITNLAPFFVIYTGAQVDRFLVSREGIGSTWSFTSVQSNSRWVPSYGGSWIGGRYVPYYGGATVTSEVPVNERGQAWIDLAKVIGVYLSYFPGRDYHWGVSIALNDRTRHIFRTKEPVLARQLADAMITLAVAHNPAALGYKKVGLDYRAVDKKDVKRLKWATLDAMLVTEVWKDGPAEAGGLKVDDVIVAVNDMPVPNAQAYVAAVEPLLETGPEIELRFQVLRGGVVQDLKIIANNAQLAYEQGKQARQAARQAKLGLALRDPTPEEVTGAGLAETGGAIVHEVLPGTLAERMDVKVGDYLLECNGRPIANRTALAEFVAANQVESLKVWRNGAVVELRAPEARQKLGISVRDLPSGDPALWNGKGVMVSTVEPKSAGADLDIRPGDLLIEANGKPIASTADLAALLVSGPITTAKVVRGGALVELHMAVSL